MTTLSNLSGSGAPLASSTLAVARGARTEAIHAAPPIDPVTQQPLPARFPWLSRLSRQLEEAAVERAAFRAAPVLGDIINEKA